MGQAFPDGGLSGHLKEGGLCRDIPPWLTKPRPSSARGLVGRASHPQECTQAPQILFSSSPAQTMVSGTSLHLAILSLTFSNSCPIIPFHSVIPFFISFVCTQKTLITPIKHRIKTEKTLLQGKKESHKSEVKLNLNQCH